MGTVTSFIFTNDSQEKVKLILEPWAEEYDIFSGMKVEIITSDPQENVIEVEYDGKDIIVHGWSDSMSVQSEGKPLAPNFGG